MHQNTTTTSIRHREDPYGRLADAIVLRAVNDYRIALRRLAKHPENAVALSTKQEIERFFRSGWFLLLTKVDPDMLIEKLNGEVRK
jgi:hypothetical protein